MAINNQPKDKYQNLGCGGFLIHKTLQPNSLHSIITPAINNLQNYNISLYIHKRFEQYRSEKGINKIPQEFLAQACLRVKQKLIRQKENKIDITTLPKKLTYKQIIEGKCQQEENTIDDLGYPNQLLTPDYQDENLKGIVKQLERYKLFEEEKNPEPLKSKKNKVVEDYHKLLYQIVDEKLSEKFIQKLFHNFKIIKTNNRFQMLKKYRLTKSNLTKNINAALNNQEETTETNFYINSIIQQHGLKL